MGVLGMGVCLWVFSSRFPAKTEQFFLIRGALWWEPLSCPPRQWRGNRGPFILIYSHLFFVCPDLACLVLTLNFSAVLKDRAM